MKNRVAKNFKINLLLTYVFLQIVFTLANELKEKSFLRAGVLVTRQHARIYLCVLVECRKCRLQIKQTLETIGVSFLLS